MMWLIILLLLAMSHGFLLQTNSSLDSSTQIAGNQQYITKAELYDIKNQLQTELSFVRTFLEHDINVVRSDMNTKLDLLTSQLQQMLTSFQQQLSGQRNRNDTTTVESLELKYNEVLRNYTRLQDQFDSLQGNYSKQEIELESVKNKTRDLEVDSNKQEIELKLVKNKTRELEDKIVNLNSLKNINQLTDLRLLQHEVQSISAQTHSLVVNEQARTQDFQALYTSLKEHEANEDGIIRSLNSTFYQNILSSEIITNASLSNVMTRINESEIHQNMKIEELEKGVNVSFLDIRQQIAKNSEKVALTSCINSDYGTKQSGHIIKYGDIRTQVNVNNLSSFISSGKFTCDREGIYLVSAWDTSDAVGSEFSIYKNGNLIANAFITNSNLGNFYTATAVVAVELIPNDTVWVQVSSQMYVYNYQRACLTIVKIK